MDGTPSSTTENKTDEKLERAVRCARCGHALTTEKHKVEIGGRHGHTFMNPSGVIFHIVCYREVAGAVVDGVPETETSWFPSTAWQYAFCANCRGQIGWAYVNLADDGNGASGERFFGLIEDTILL